LYLLHLFTSYFPLIFSLTFFFVVLRRPPTSTLFPYTTLFRSFDDTLRLAASVADAGHSSLLSCVQAGRWYAAPTAVILVEQSERDRKSTRLNSSHVKISYAVFCLKKKKENKEKKHSLTPRKTI